MKVIDLLKVICIDDEVSIYDYNTARRDYYTCPTKVDDKHLEKTVIYVGANMEGTLAIYIK